MASPGNLDRVGTLYKNAPSAGVGGAVVDSLVVIIQDLWCRVVTISAKAIVTGARDAGDAEAVWICRYFPEMDEGLFFDFEGKKYQVMRADHLGRRESIQFYGKAIT